MLLGARVGELDAIAGMARISFEARPEFCNPAGSVQGSFVAAMLDEAKGICAIAHASHRATVSTPEFRVTFLAAARALQAVARVIRMGSRTVFVEADLIDPTGTVLARMSSTAITVEQPDRAAGTGMRGSGLGPAKQS